MAEQCLECQSENVDYFATELAYTTFEMEGDEYKHIEVHSNDGYVNTSSLECRDCGHQWEVKESDVVVPREWVDMLLSYQHETVAEAILKFSTMKG